MSQSDERKNYFGTKSCIRAIPVASPVAKFLSRWACIVLYQGLRTSQMTLIWFLWRNQEFKWAGAEWAGGNALCMGDSGNPQNKTKRYWRWKKRGWKCPPPPPPHTHTHIHLRSCNNFIGHLSLIMWLWARVLDPVAQMLFARTVLISVHFVWSAKRIYRVAQK